MPFRSAEKHDDFENETILEHMKKRNILKTILHHKDILKRYFCCFFFVLLLQCLDNKKEVCQLVCYRRRACLRWCIWDFGYPAWVRRVLSVQSIWLFTGEEISTFLSFCFLSNEIKRLKKKQCCMNIHEILCRVIYAWLYV